VRTTRAGTRAATGWGAAGAVALLALPTPVSAQGESYLDFDGLTEALEEVASSDLAELRSLGTSVEGREIWMLEIADRSGAPLEERPGMLVVGNLSADHLIGSHLTLEVARHFVQNVDDPEVADVLEGSVLYLVPRLNPDGAEATFSGPAYGRTRNALPYDDDNDGRTDEDGPEDLNGDGVITVMRVADPAGPYMVHPEDDRLMKRADPAMGETGAYELYREGVDSDGDGFVNEDGPGGVDLDRNFQHAYPYWEADAGPHMVSEPESRALMDFVVATGNIAAMLTFGHTDNLVTPPNSQGRVASATTPDLATFADASLDDLFEVGGDRPPATYVEATPSLRGAQPGRDNPPQSGRRPAETVNEDDLEYFSTVSRAYREITGIDEIAVQRTPEGAFFQYGYFQHGVPSFTTPGWGFAEDAEGADEEGDARLLGLLEGAGADAFVDWETVQHPELGEVEVGGFRPPAMTTPPVESVAELGAAHGAFVARLAGMLPRIEIAETEVEAMGGGVYAVTVEVANRGFLPTSLQHGVVSRAVDPTTVQIQLPPERIVSGEDKTVQFRQLLGSGSRDSFTWVVRGSAGEEVEITVLSQKGGRDAATVTLR